MVPAQHGRTVPSAPFIFILGLMALLGTIVAPATPAVAAGLTVTPASIAFGNVVIGTTSPAQTVSAANSAKSEIQFERIVATAPFLTTGSTCDGSLDGGQACHIDVACQPTALGTVAGTLTFFMNKDQKVIVNLTCNGVNPPTPTPTATPTASVSGAAIQNGMSGAAIAAVAVNPDGSDGSTLATATANGSGQFSIVVAPPQKRPRALPGERRHLRQRAEWSDD